MAGILSFDSARLDSLLNERGLERTWLSLLATTASKDKKFHYILKDDLFRDIDVLNSDLLEGLSIGELSVLYEYSVASNDSDQRKTNGQFFTPDDVARFMAGFASQFDAEGVWLDPCSGVGNLTWHLTNLQANPEHFLLNQMLVADHDPLALIIARVQLAMSFQKTVPNLFHRLESRFIEFDFLSVADNGNPDLFQAENPLTTIPKHDFVIMNPPYLATDRDARFETSEAADLYAYFIENTAKSSTGFIAVTPQSFTNAKKFRSLRALLLRSFPEITIFAFDNVPANIFRGIKFGSKNSNTANSTRAAITIAGMGPQKHRITGLTRWKSKERARLFEEAESFLSEVELSEEFFPKVQANHKDLYRAVVELPRLQTLLKRGKSEYSLFVPSSPRYFIPGLMSPAKRASQRQLFFGSIKDRDRAYLLINSSLMYWWWRVRDGGMTLSLETLSSLPVPDFNTDQTLVEELTLSEIENKVYKQNGGSAQENVKHPVELINRLNCLVLPEYAGLLLTTHQNSEFSSQ